MSKQEALAFAVAQLRLLGTEQAVAAAEELAPYVRDARLTALLELEGVREHVAESLWEQIRDIGVEWANDHIEELDDASLWEELKYAMHPTIETEEQERAVEKVWAEVKDLPTLPLPIK